MKDLVGKGKPFYSAMDMAAKALKRKVGTGSEFLKELMALPGVKPTELKERNLEGLMNAPRMTHEEFLTHLAAKPAPAIREKILKNPTADDVEKAVRKKLEKTEAEELKSQGYSKKEIEQELEGYANNIKRNRPTIWDQIWRNTYSDLNQNPTAHDQYTLPGGERYREMLIKAPKGGDEFPGVSQHFGGEPGILASMRLKDRTGPNGEKLLHLEELQSDWHQQGREKGYKGNTSTEGWSVKSPNPYEPNEVIVYNQDGKPVWTGTNRFGTDRQIIDKVSARLQEDKVPDAPFKKNWEEMALKRLMHHAAEKGYHGLVVTPGDVQADRYSLAKHVGMVAYHPEEQRFQAFKPNRETVMNERGVTPERISELIGKEAAERLLKAPKVGDHHFLEGEQLQMGGEGMKAFYDKKVPNILNAIGKKHGVKTGVMKVPMPSKDSTKVLGYPGGEEYVQGRTNWDEFLKQSPQAAKEIGTHLHHFPITEPMRQDILKNGLPLYKEGGMIHKAIGGTVQPSINQMRTALMENKFAVPASDLKSVGAQEAPQLDTKVYVNEGGQDGMGGVDMNAMQPGMQLMQAQPNLDPTKNQPQQGGQPPSAGASSPAQQPPSYILQMTRQGQAMNAMTPPQQPQGLAKGGQPSVEEMRIMLSPKYKPVAKKASEVLGQHEGKHLKVTQADRTKVGEGFLGGPGFSSLQHVDPDYAGLAWGVNHPSAASKLVNATRAHPEGDVLWSTLLGAPNQHTSNQMVFDMLLKQFKAAIKAGKMTPELRDAINAKLAMFTDNEGNRYFEGNDNIANKNFFKNLKTFDQRREMANLMGGLGVGGKKGQIIDYDKTVADTTEPELLGAPTHAIGPRLFQLSGLRSYQPEIHPAFPHILHGEDLGEMFHPVPKELMLPEFHEHIKNTKGRKVGFMDLTRNTPSQHITEKFLTSLQKAGHKKGGKVKDNLDTMRLALTKNSKKKAK